MKPTERRPRGLPSSVQFPLRTACFVLNLGFGVAAPKLTGRWANAMASSNACVKHVITARYRTRRRVSNLQSTFSDQTTGGGNVQQFNNRGYKANMSTAENGARRLLFAVSEHEVREGNRLVHETQSQAEIAKPTLVLHGHPALRRAIFTFFFYNHVSLWCRILFEKPISGCTK